MTKEISVGSVTVRVLSGDICDRPVDAIVNAANNQLWMGAGVAGAIKRRGGPEIEREAVAKGPIPVGDAVATTAGVLDAKYVIHAAVMGADLVTDADTIARATRSALALADELGLRSIALPALGTGVGGFDMRECAQMMREAALAHIAGGTGLTLVEFVLFGEQAYEEFGEVFTSP